MEHSWEHIALAEALVWIVDRLADVIRRFGWKVLRFQTLSGEPWFVLGADLPQTYRFTKRLGAVLVHAIRTLGPDFLRRIFRPVRRSAV